MKFLKQKFCKIRKNQETRAHLCIYIGIQFTIMTHFY